MNLYLDTKEKPFRCSCSRSFTRKDLLKRHQKRDHVNQRQVDAYSEFEKDPHVLRSQSRLSAEPEFQHNIGVDFSTNFQTEIRSSTTPGSSMEHDIHESTCTDILEDFTAFLGSAGFISPWDEPEISMWGIQDNPTHTLTAKQPNIHAFTGQQTGSNNHQQPVESDFAKVVTTEDEDGWVGLHIPQRSTENWHGNFQTGMFCLSCRRETRLKSSKWEF